MDRYTRNKKRRENQKSQKSLNKMKLETEILREELNHGVLLVNRIHRERLRLVDAMEAELEKQAQLQAKIEDLKAEYARLQKSVKTNNKLLEHTQNNRKQLEYSVGEVETKTEKMRVKAETKTIKNNVARLMSQVQENRNPKEASILMTCIRQFIQTMSENEFEEHNWIAKVAETKQYSGGRIRFDNIYMAENDLKKIYQPVVQDLAARFGKNNVSIKAKTAKTNGVVTCLDITVKIPITVNTAGLELP